MKKVAGALRGAPAPGSCLSARDSPSRLRRPQPGRQVHTEAHNERKAGPHCLSLVLCSTRTTRTRSDERAGNFEGRQILAHGRRSPHVARYL